MTKEGGVDAVDASPANRAHDWWRQAVVYQIYPRSFADANGDGLGDLPGITSRVDYLQQLGIDAVWLSPFYPSALADGGYDVDDYRDVDPRLGTLTDFDSMVTALHTAGIRVIVDIVPNHSSNRHRWFRDAIASPPGSPERARYIFREGRGPNGALPPSDWPSHFAPSAWTRTSNPDGSLGQWYLHLFAPEQPDFNWDNREVQLDFLTTLRFWADRGVDGFRIDVAHALKKDLTEPFRSRPKLTDMVNPLAGNDELFDRDDVHEIYREWRQVFNEYSPPRMAVAEAWVEPARRPLYARADELGQAFNFDLLESEWDAAEYRAIITDNLTMARDAETSSTWVLSNHDVVRHPSRYGLRSGTDLKKWLLGDGAIPPVDRAMGLRRARAATMLILALPGSTYLYQGEELGLFEVSDIPHDRIQDPVWTRMSGAEKGRDGCRVPLPWTPERPAFGFSPVDAHLPQPDWFAELSVQTQDSMAGSTLDLYRRALALRRQWQSTETLEWQHTTNNRVLHFVRPNGFASVTTFNRTTYSLPSGRVLLSSGALDGSRIPPNTTVWLAPET